MSGYPGCNAINWERRISEGTQICKACKKAIVAGAQVDVRLDGYPEDPSTFCVPCVTPQR